jgi:hypothetical protein
VRAIRVTQWPVLLKYCWASTAVRPLGQVALAAEGSTSTEEKSPNRKLLDVERPLTSVVSPPFWNQWHRYRVPCTWISAASLRSLRSWSAE